MPKKRAAVPLFLVFLALTIVYPVYVNTAFGQNTPRTWIVDQSGGGDATSIQTAINQAQAGDVVNVKPGIYYEHIYITKSLTLTGLMQGNTVINGLFGGRIITVSADNVKISNFTLKNSGWNINYGAICILGNSFNVTVSNCLFQNNNCGVCIEPQAYATVLDNTILGNDTYSSSYTESAGILMLSNYCVAKNNSIQNTAYGIMVNGNHNLIQNNTIRGYLYSVGGTYYGSHSGVGVLSGQRVYIYPQVTATDNTVTCNTISGCDYVVWLNNFNNWVFIQNNFYGLGFYGGSSTPISCIWNSSYPTGGNFWSRTGIDNFSGPNQDIPGSDGIFDYAVALFENNVDYYPFKNAITTFTYSTVPQTPPYQSTGAVPTIAPTPTPKPTATPTPAPTPRITPYPTTRYSTPISTAPKAPTPSPAPVTNLDLSWQSNTNASDFKIDIEGTLIVEGKHFSGVTVTFSHTTDGVEWTYLPKVVTDANGNFKLDWAPQPGNYRLRGQIGQTTDYPATTSVVNVYVAKVTNKTVCSVFSGSQISHGAFNNKTGQLTFTLSGSEGTTGHAKIFLPKTAVENMANLKISFDQTPINFDYTAQGDSWVISFGYRHSSHDVVVDLNSVQTQTEELTSIDFFWLEIAVACIAAGVVALVIAFGRRRRPAEKAVT